MIFSSISRWTVSIQVTVPFTLVLSSTLLFPMLPAANSLSAASLCGLCFCFSYWTLWCLRVAVAHVSYSPEGRNWTLWFSKRLVTRCGVGLILQSVPVEPAKNPPFLQAMNPVVAPNFFLCWLLNICVLLILKTWLVPSYGYCRALLKAGCPFFTDIPCTHGVCLLSLGSFVPVMFCFSTKIEKAKWFLFSYSKAV